MSERGVISYPEKEEYPIVECTICKEKYTPYHPTVPGKYVCEKCTLKRNIDEWKKKICPIITRTKHVMCLTTLCMAFRIIDSVTPICKIIDKEQFYPPSY